MKLSIIVLNYKTPKLTMKCIASLNKQYLKELKSGQFEIIIVDNYSNDNSIKLFEDFLGKYPKSFKLAKNNKNVGFGGGCNYGAKFASGKYLLFLNSDTIVLDRGLLKMLKVFDGDAAVAIVGGRLITDDRIPQKTAGRFPDLLNVFASLLGVESLLFSRSPTETKEVDWVSGGCLMISRKVFTRLAGFDEKIFMYTEDVEICFRAHLLGYKIIFYPFVKIIHETGASSNFAFMIINTYKSRLYYFKKHKSKSQYLFIKKLFSIKAYLYYQVGRISNNDFLKNTYEEVYKMYR